MIAASRVKDASFDVFSSLVHARSEAITRNATVRLCSNSGMNWEGGWTVTSDTSCASITTANTVRTQDTFSNIRVTGATAEVSFNGMGRANANASFTIDASGVIERNKRCVVLDASGRPVTKPPVQTGFTCP